MSASRKPKRSRSAGPVEGLRAQADARQRLVAALRVGVGQVGGDRALGDVQAAAAHERPRGGLQLEGAPQAEGLVGQAGVGWVQIVVAKRARATERRRHRIADPPALEHDDPPDPLRRVIRREQPHDAASDHEEVAVTVEALAAPDAHALLARLRERAPLSWVPALDGWLVLRRDLALHVMGDADDVHRRRPALLDRAGRRPEHAHARRRRAPAPPRAVRAAVSPAARQGALHRRGRRRGRPPDRRHRARGRGRAAARLRRPAGRGDRDPLARAARGRHRRRPGLVRRDRRGRHRGHGRRRGARGRPRGVRGAAGRHRAGARPRARLVAAGRRRRRPRALGGHLQRRGHALRRHRDDRGHDRQRDRAPALPSRRSSRS